MEREGTGASSESRATGGRVLGAADVWRQLAKSSFAVLAHVTSAGEPRSSGIVYCAARGKLYVAVAPTSYKARQIATGDEVSITVLVRRGGILSLVMPIPPATITFQARAAVHPAGSLDIRSLPKQFQRLLPGSRRATACVLELTPVGQFLTYGIGVSLSQMRDPVVATRRVAVS